MKRFAVMAAMAAALGVAVAAPMVGNLSAPAPTPAPTGAVPDKLGPPLMGDTPMGQRVATIGILNKRNGLSRELRMRPGDAVRLGDVVVRLKACETTADWEADQLTGAFVQLIVRGADTKWRKYFSGWLYKETPSLNVAEHPIYDVWTKACAMRHADVGPDTVTLSGDTGSTAGSRSSARKSPVTDAPAEDTPDATAASSNAI